MNKKKAEKLLDYAIKRINQYDEVSSSYSYPLVIDRVDRIEPCKGCSLSDGRCHECPFSFNPTAIVGCRYAAYGVDPNSKEHVKNLIKATKDWCKKFMPDYTIEEIKK